jgi:thiamine biosynthesis lipoprotein
VESTAPERILAEVELMDASLGVSAAWGRTALADGRVHGHVLDPRSGEPADRAVLAAVVLPDATEADALSTALLVLGAEGLPTLQAFRPSLRALVIPSVQADPAQRVVRLGF